MTPREGDKDAAGCILHLLLFVIWAVAVGTLAGLLIDDPLRRLLWSGFGGYWGYRITDWLVPRPRSTNGRD